MYEQFDEYRGRVLPRHLWEAQESAAFFFTELYRPAQGHDGLHCEIRPEPTWNAKPERRIAADPYRRWIPLSDADAGARLAAEVRLTDQVVRRRVSKRSQLHGQVYYAVNPRRPGGGTKDDVVGYVTAYADLELGKAGVSAEDALRTLAALPLKPSACIWSGRGMHVYWFFDRFVGPLDLARVERLNAGIAIRLKDLHADRSVRDVSRILRPPGTYNRKGGAEGIAVRLLACSPERRYRLLELERTYPGPLPQDTVRVPSVNLSDRELPDFQQGSSWHESVRRHLAAVRGRGASDDQVRNRALELAPLSKRKGAEGEVVRLAEWVNKTIDPNTRPMRGPRGSRGRR